MPQLAMRQQITMGQFALTRQLLMSEQQQQQQHQQHQQRHQQVAAPAQAAVQKPTRVTKVRRTRQSRNPQLSVARRNERERNRVKMVNNGFALLRDHLPIEYLQQTSQGYESAGSETPDLGPAGAKSPSSQSSKAKKFSKVETLRAAIQHIKMLEELMRSAEPNFESINIGQDQQQQQQQMMMKQEDSQIGYDEIDSGPFSCGSASSLTSSSLTIQQQQQQQAVVQGAVYSPSSSSEQFVKIEPFVASSHIQFQAQQQQQMIQPASPLDSATTTIHTPPASQQHASVHYLQAPAAMMTQVHHHNQHGDSASSEHTHLWIQQHQNSFMEQQQQQQQQYDSPNQEQWTHYQPRYVRQTEIPVTSSADGSIQVYQQQQQQQQVQFVGQPLQQQQPQVDSPPTGHWFAPSPPNSTIQQQVASESANFINHNHLHHQISLYSQ